MAGSEVPQAPERTAAEDLAAETSARREAERALAMVDALLASSLMGVALLDTQLRYVRVNDVLARLNGRPVEEHLGRTLREVLGRGAEVLEPIIREVIETGASIDNVELEVPHFGPRGETHVFLASYFPVRTHAGEILGVGAMVADITHQKHIEVELANAVRQRDTLLALVSHDLRNPLGALQVAAALLANSKHLDEARTRRQLETIQRSVRRMGRLIDDLVDMESIQRGRLAIVRKPVDAHRLVTEALETTEPAARAKQIALERATDLEGVSLSCDRDRMLQVLGNLLSNAVKFCGPGDRITVRAQPVNEHVRFEVADTGPGISPADLPHVFDLYWSAPHHAGKGSGLGLYIAKGIVEAHGGRIDVESRPGAGATFRFTVPRAPPP